MLGHILLPGSLGTEETMKRQWHVRREAVERPDAEATLGPGVPGHPAVEPRKRARLALRAQTRARTARRSTMRVAAYVRVSTSRQVKLQTIEQQLEMVSKYAQGEGMGACRRRTSSATTATAARR